MKKQTTMKQGAKMALAVLTLFGLSASLRADVKNVWVGVNGATCPT